jgi:hypothetical protein
MIQRLLPFLTLVALFNYFSIKHTVTSGGDDLDKVDGQLMLTLARGTEPYTPFNSPEVLEHPDPGEVIYVDNSIVMCRRWNWRQGDQTKTEVSNEYCVIRHGNGVHPAVSEVERVRGYRFGPFRVRDIQRFNQTVMAQHHGDVGVHIQSFKACWASW